ncbi:hypothetical protein FHW83_003724 [Duganella sp. SG902]|uniref:hypothetical protein n=1 Tax=Duganella sp. SG902 TaxID=2587016 RepID=UPI00159D6FC1|nr:hypothetical protein [Duganella sp. SG902]NVM77901.1 hypothetical protein [Duganella sp. SG902]
MAGAVSRKQWFALIVAVTLTAHYFFFRVPFVANDYGRNMAEWPLLADALISFPLLYYFMFRPSLKQFLTACLAIATAGVLAGRMLIPEESKQLWRGIEGYWLQLVLAEAALEIYLLVLVVRRVKALLRLSGNVDEALESAIHARFGKSGFAPFALFEMRIWYYGLFMRKGERLRYRGEQHFSYDKNDGNVSNQFAFIMVMLFELPLSHLMLHLMSVKPWVAWLADILTLWSMLYLVAEYRASQWRPVSLDREALLIRNGVFARDREIDYSMIESVVRCEENIRRQRGILRYRQFGRLNLEIRLREGAPHSKIYLSLDKPDAFIDALRQRLPA